MHGPPASRHAASRPDPRRAWRRFTFRRDICKYYRSCSIGCDATSDDRWTSSTSIYSLRSSNIVALYAGYVLNSLPSMICVRRLLRLNTSSGRSWLDSILELLDGSCGLVLATTAATCNVARPSQCSQGRDSYEHGDTLHPHRSMSGQPVPRIFSAL